MFSVSSSSFSARKSNTETSEETTIPLLEAQCSGDAKTGQSTGNEGIHDKLYVAASMFLAELLTDILNSCIIEQKISRLFKAADQMLVSEELVIPEF